MDDSTVFAADSMSAEELDRLAGFDPDATDDREPDQQPQPLSVRSASEPYPVDALPSVIRKAVVEVGAFVKAPIPLVVGCALSSLSVVAQCQADVRRAEKLEGPSSLNLLTIADSGERKTTCDGMFTSAIRQWEAEQAEAAQPLIDKYTSRLAAWTAERDGLAHAIREASKKGKSTDDFKKRLDDLHHDKPQAPRIPHLIIGDETPEHLAWRLAKEWPAAGVISSEAGLIFGAHGMGKDSIARNLGLLNVLWDGGSHSVGRKTSESFVVRNARLTVGLQIQEPTLRSFFESSGGLARGTGFLARFLIAWPESTQGTRAFTEPPRNWPALSAFHRRIAELLRIPAPLNEQGGLAPPMLEFDVQAKALWVNFHDQVEAELAEGRELYDVRDVASKTADNAARLAALFSVFETGTAIIDADTMGRAARLASWHLSEALRFFGGLAIPPEMLDAARVERWAVEHCLRERVSEVGKNTLRQYGPVRDGARLDEALRELDNRDRARVIKDGRRLIVRPHPALVPGGADGTR